MNKFIFIVLKAKESLRKILKGFIMEKSFFLLIKGNKTKVRKVYSVKEICNTDASRFNIQTRQYRKNQQ